MRVYFASSIHRHDFGCVVLSVFYLLWRPEKTSFFPFLCWKINQGLKVRAIKWRGRCLFLLDKKVIKESTFSRTQMNNSNAFEIETVLTVKLIKLDYDLKVSECLNAMMRSTIVEAFFSFAHPFVCISLMLSHVPKRLYRFTAWTFTIAQDQQIQRHS